MECTQLICRMNNRKLDKKSKETQNGQFWSKRNEIAKFWQMLDKWIPHLLLYKWSLNAGMQLEELLVKLLIMKINKSPLLWMNVFVVWVSFILIAAIRETSTSTIFNSSTRLSLHFILFIFHNLNAKGLPIYFFVLTLFFVRAQLFLLHLRVYNSF